MHVNKWCRTANIVNMQKRRNDDLTIPPNLPIGASSSSSASYQVEGAWNVSGKSLHHNSLHTSLHPHCHRPSRAILPAIDRFMPVDCCTVGGRFSHGYRFDLFMWNHNYLQKFLAKTWLLRWNKACYLSFSIAPTRQPMALFLLHSFQAVTSLYELNMTTVCQGNWEEWIVNGGYLGDT